MIDIKLEDGKEITDKKNNKMLLAAFMIFIFPIISIFVGIFIGGYLGRYIGVSIKISQIIGGIVIFILSVIIIKLFDKSLKTDDNAEKIYWDDL